jgi:hypothetical protein
LSDPGSDTFRKVASDLDQSAFAGWVGEHGRRLENGLCILSQPPNPLPHSVADRRGDVDVGQVVAYSLAMAVEHVTAVSH